MLDFSGALLGKKMRPISIDQESVPPHKKPAAAKPSKRKRNRYSRLSGGIFRWLNEQLYTAESQVSLDLFRASPEYFQQVISRQYHQGFQTQVESWPMNPLDWVLEEIQGRISEENVKIADLGCGEGRLALELGQYPNVTVLSYDLCAVAPHVTVADISHLPVPDHSIDIAVFCLSLMGKNHVDFLIEARRCLRKK